MAERIRSINEDREWHPRDIFHLKNGLSAGKSVAEIAIFLSRREDEIRRKAQELRLLLPR